MKHLLLLVTDLDVQCVPQLQQVIVQDLSRDEEPVPLLHWEVLDDTV